MKNKVILIKSNVLGEGDVQLGATLIETFLTVLKQQDEKPEAIFVLNSGVELVTELSLCSLHLKELEDAGVQVLACTTCLNHFGFADKQVVGVASSMLELVNLASKYEVISL